MELSHITEVNVQRCYRWHNGTIVTKGGNWTLADWSNALAGEVGELCNVIKKIRRVETNATNRLDPEMPELLQMAADEYADVFFYLDLLAEALGINRELALKSKFDRVSVKQEFPERL